MSKQIYLDSAATSSVHPQVIQVMVEVLQQEYGNPSSTHSFGRSSKTLVETSRKSIAKQLNCSAQEIIFTSNGTEATNWILTCLVKTQQVKRIITTKIEHHATLYTVLALQKEFAIQVDYVSILPSGAIDMNHFKELLELDISTLVSLMHVNNEIGTVLEVEKVGAMCQDKKAFFFCDTVQSIGKTTFDLTTLPVDFIVASAHKFHGPKGVGFAFMRKNTKIQPLLFGGSQEKGLRAGTEAVHQIVGMSKAFDLCYQNLEADKKQISDLKAYCLRELLLNFPDLKVNGSDTFYNIINVLLPFSPEKTAMILFNLDIKGIAVSRGSACQSGSVKPSHVLSEILNDVDIKKPSIRISFSHDNCKADIDALIDVLKGV